MADGNLAYVIGTSDITIVNVEQSGQPDRGRHVRLGHAQHRRHEPGCAGRKRPGGGLGNTNGTFNFLVYSLATPSSPTLLGNTTIDYQFPGSLFVAGDYGLRDDRPASRTPAPARTRSPTSSATSWPSTSATRPAPRCPPR